MVQKLHNKQAVVHNPVNNKQFELSNIEFCVRQGSLLGPLLFLISINDLRKAMIYSSVYHFADDTNIIYTRSSLKDMNNEINHNLSNLGQWLRATKIPLNITKIEIVIFKPDSK